jgi:ketosteroid isomerase-like protein
MNNDNVSTVIRAFYEARAAGDIVALRGFLADDVRWVEPTVGEHMGELNGAEAVLDMISRALVTTGGSFALRVGELVEVEGHCSAVIHWSASKGDRTLQGRELATFSVAGGKIAFAQFLPENIAHDDAFWA